MVGHVQHEKTKAKCCRVYMYMQSVCFLTTCLLVPNPAFPSKAKSGGFQLSD